MQQLILASPLAGWATPLEEVPDEVFSGRTLGDGIAIDPTGTTLYAPCDGEIVVVPASKHAVTLRTEGGVDVLLHVGIDTVELQGAGFELHVGEGDRVRCGDPLLTFDLDFLARRAKSLLTPVIVTEWAGARIVRMRRDCALKVGDFLMEIVGEGSMTPLPSRDADARAPEAETRVPETEHLRARPRLGSAPSKADESSPAIVSRRLTVALEHGIHARPAALLAGRAKGFAAAITVRAHGRTANAKSPISWMSLGVRQGDELIVEAAGPDAKDAIAAIDELLQAPTHAGVEAAAAPVRDARMSISLRADSSGQQASGAVSQHASGAVSIAGVVASRGLAAGHAVRLARAEVHVEENGAGVEQELATLDRARERVRANLVRLAQSGAGAQREIVSAHLELLDDPELLAQAREALEQGKSAGYAWRKAVQRSVAMLRATGDPLLMERVDDLLDLEHQILLASGGQALPSTHSLPENAILIARELLPSQLVTLDAARIAGICTAAGGPTSHVAILAAALGIPALVAAGPAVLDIEDGTPLVLDAERGLLRVDPAPSEWSEMQTVLAARRKRRSIDEAAAQRECRTQDGTRIEIFANVGSLADARAAVACGAEGCGLLRTEFLFLERREPPSEAEQAARYQEIVDAFGGRPVVIRTLDAGGDKPIPYLPLPHEDNPALGMRGVRTSLWRLDLLRAQLRAISSVRPHEPCRVLLPMIASPSEVRSVRAVLNEARREAGLNAAIPVGVMIETPASAVIADQLAREADFFSIGTNDLTQYALAMDRGHPELAAQLDSLHPAVLRLIAGAAKAARALERPVAVCGALASDPLAAPILIGLGIEELSAVPPVIPRLKALVGSLTMEECRRIARQALEQETAQAVRALAKEWTQAAYA